LEEAIEEKSGQGRTTVKMLTDHLQALLTLGFSHEKVYDVLHSLNPISYTTSIGIEHVWIELERAL
jgi:hypothetical protein